MTRPPRRPVEDFAAVFCAISRQTREPVVLVGGHAVNVWALTYKDRIGAALHPLLPLTSGDMDVFATRNALLALHHELGGRLLLSGPREITEGTLVVGTAPDTREIDVLRSMKGVPKITSQDTIQLEVCGFGVPVLFPHLLLQGKLANALALDQAGRQDVKHVKILGLVLREFLAEVVGSAAAANEQPTLTLLSNTLDVLTSGNAVEFERRHRAGLVDVMPREALAASPLRRLAAFGLKQLPRRLAMFAKRIDPGETNR
ncbi:MAG: hypothetical protein PHE83_17665 [Opitutaceae bacterium]|nr:hypothetical protein [Opitutaceae bacterium]